ncbi:unnamed protein product [Didymodactylos carnosus]|uniref:Uncharacterized protein n=1 Tax=Didymodactylos carnosus TaxID=1234261 RepID=A0A813YMG5_9BILA|nr:unnamed protein product [Didymodactylos carnosus]CAF1107280.1 unnamed protein product [Didymodactylos carnosus]CAF3671418.1 unnamed protein product [Didymodactylos carnosus]CAF3872103.1 unnamed protein product [Didymodactylos carnosus]
MASTLKIPDYLKSNVVYEATCPVCGDKYLNKVRQHLTRSFNEHITDQNKCIPVHSQPAAITKSVSVTRTGKLPPSIRNANSAES